MAVLQGFITEVIVSPTLTSFAVLIPEMMYPNVKELSDNYLRILDDREFRDEYYSLLKIM